MPFYNYGRDTFMQETVRSLQEKGICPTCYNFKYGGIYKDFTKRILYEDDLLYCFFEERPRSVGHTIILLKEHYNDMTYIPDDICARAYVFAKKMMNILKESLSAERVYLCTMCDGNINHFHIQLIPRYRDTNIGSKNFVKERTNYVENEIILNSIRMKLEYIKE